MAEQLTDQTGNLVYVSRCDGCNTCWDAGGCEHHGSPPKRYLNAQGQTWEADAILKLHRSVKLLALLNNLLRNSDSSILVRLVVKEPPPGVAPMNFLLQNSHDMTSFPLGLLVGVLDNCSAPFPKAAHLAAAALSILVTRRPSVALSLLDPESLAEAIFKYCGESIFHLVNNSECPVEEYFGVIAFINVLPLLYFLGDWKEAQRVLPKHQLPAMITTTAVNILFSAADDDAWDSPPDVDQLPELGGANVWVRPLFQSTDISSTVLDERPMSFAVAGAIEVLGRWANKGLSVGDDPIPVSRGPPATVKSSFQEFEPQLQVLMTRTPAIAPLVEPIVNAIADGHRPRLPASVKSLLHEPLLRASQCCALSSCNRTTSPDGGILYRCSGGCGGLARYCSTEHQTEHWPQHKYFCKFQSTKKQEMMK